MATEREKMTAGELYDPNDEELVQARIRARQLCENLNAGLAPGPAARRSILTDLLATGGDTANIQPPFFCDYGFNIFCGKNVFWNFQCVVLDVCPVTIGDYCQFGPLVQIYTATHPMNALERRLKEYARPIQIGNDVWIGGGAIVCPGVTIGARTVIGAGSVVTRDIPPDVFAAGNPCRVIRPLEQ